MLYVGSFSNPAEGYAQAALQYVMALQQTGYQNFRLWPVQGMVNYRLLPPWCEPLSVARREQPDVNDLAIIHYTPDAIVHPTLRRGLKKNVALTVTETTHLPKWVVDRMNETLDGVIVPTEWNRKVLEDSGITKPLYVLPHTQGEYFKQAVAAHAANRSPDDPWTFYYIGTWTPRKNPEAVLRGYLRAFPDPRASNTRLVMKISRNSAVMDLIASIVTEETGSAIRLEQDINIFADFWNDDQIAWLHAIGDCYVSAHYGEGWGIGTFQSALSGKRQISTRWSAPVEYLPAEMADWVDYDMVDVAPLGFNVMFYNTGKFDAPLLCAKPRMGSLVAAYRKSAEERLPVDPEHVQHLWDTYGWKAVGDRFVELLDKLKD